MPPEEPRRILSSVDETILREAWKYRFLQTGDFQRLLGFQSTPHTRRLLRRLCGGRDFADRQYLLRAPLPTTRTGGVSKFYCLGSRGVEYVARELGVPVRSYRPSRLRGLGFSHVSHALLLSRFVIAAWSWIRAQSAFRLLDTRLSYELAGEPDKLAVIPDAFLLFEKAGKKYPIWIEIDNASEFFKKWSDYLQGRIECIRSGGYARAFPEASGAVVMAYAAAGPSRQAAETRRETLQRWTMQVLQEREMQDWAGIFRFTSLVWEEMYGQGLFEKAVWYRPDAPQPLPLIPS